jgi:YD repeat-containing protein
VTFDAVDRIASQWEFKADNSVITGLDYQRDNVGNPTHLREATGRLTTWTYDDDNQLINEHRSSATEGFNTTHTYDPTGNRLVKNEAGSITTSTFDPANQTIIAINPDGTTTFTFDAAGNQQLESGPTGIKTSTWDYENQQTQILLPNGQRETMTYNADLRQFWKE